MRTTLSRRLSVGLALLALALVAVPSALASDATTDQIIRDVAADGRVDGSYSTSALKAALASPLLGQYGGSNGPAGVQAALGNPDDDDETPSSDSPGSAPAADSSPSPDVAGTGSAESGNLPFTGADLALFAGLGGVLVAAGFALRRLGRDHEPQA